MVTGRYCDGRSSAAHPAEMFVDRDGVVRVVGLADAIGAPFATVRISDRIGNIPRRIAFADGSAFETADNDAIDGLLAALGEDGLLQAVSRWERSWLPALVALFGVALISLLFVQLGIPRLADFAALNLPTATDRAIGLQGLEILDRTLLDPSTLPQQRRAELTALFARMTAPLDDGHDYRLELRAGNDVGANAFALPSGIVVMTDELDELAQRDEEIVSVLAHEVGHVRGRHALRLLLRNAGVAALALAVLGDVSSASALAAAVPTALVHARYSRQFENEADDFAYRWLDDNGVERRHFASILGRLEEAYGDGAGRSFSWLSSHPATAERTRD